MEAKSKLRKLGDVYSEHAKIVFLFDVSSSMNYHVAKTYTDQYQWTPEILADIRQRVTDVVAKVNQLVADPMGMAPLVMSEEEMKINLLSDRERGPNGEVIFNPKDDEDLMERVVRHDLIGFFGIA